ncbi:MAG: putative Ig domain-containing protein [Acidobacteriia bacterium]|nr:putative Ig domain-containing protein [Terriglobia bacterium]
MKKLRWIAAISLACLGLLSTISCGGGSSSQISITLTTPGGILSVDESQPNATPPVAPTLDFTAAVGGDTKNQGVKWELLKQSGCSGTGTGAGQCGTLTNSAPFSVTYTPPGNLSARLSVVLTATSLTDKTATKTATISVVLPPTFSTTACIPSGVLPCSLAAGNNGVPYTATISFTGGVAPYTFNNPSLPACLKLNTTSTSTTTTIVGTPCGSGSTTFTLTVTDSGGTPGVSQDFTINIAPPPTLSVTTTSLPQGTLNAAYNGNVSTTGGVAPLSWDFEPTPGPSLPPGDIAGLPPGLLANIHNGQITGIPTDQSAATPPVSYPATYSVTVQVHDSSLPAPGQTAPSTPRLLSITIQKPAPLSITTQGPLSPGTTATAYSGGGLQASGGIKPYTWKVTQGLLPAGLTLTTLNDGTGSISGVPILAGTANFTVQVSDSRLDPISGNPNPATASKPFSIVITGATGSANNKLLSGAYTLFFRGFDDDGVVFTVGQITANGNGLITSGTEDTNRGSGVGLGQPVTGTYSILSDGHGTLELTSNFANTAPLTEDYNLVLDSNGNARFFENNLTTTSNPKHTFGEGILKPTVGTAFASSSFGGNYAFLFSGREVPPSAKPVALAGFVYANGVSTLSPGMSDLNDAGAFSSQTISGDFAVVSGNRGAGSFTFQVPNKPQITLTFIFYFVSSSDLYWVEADADSKTFKPTQFQLAGEMILQQPTTTFDQNVLQGSSVATGTGINSSGNASVFAGLLTSALCDGSTPIALNSDDNNDGTISAQSFSGTCAVTTNGRVGFNLAGIGSPAPSPRVGVAYLTGPGTGFLLGGDAAVTTGLLEQQSGGPFADSSLLGGYTLSAPFLVNAQTKNVVGQVTVDGNGIVAGKVDETDPPATAAPTLGQSLSAAIDIGSLQANGRGTMTTSLPVPKGFPTNSIFYVVSPSSFRIIANDPGVENPQLLLFDH